MSTDRIFTIEASLKALLDTQYEILQLLKEQKSERINTSTLTHVTAKEFMDAVHIRRTKFDELVAENRIRIVKKKRRIYMPFGEIARFFNDPAVN